VFRLRTEMTNRITRRLQSMADAFPQLGHDFAFEQGNACSSHVDNQRPRNRWSRNDLSSAIGQDPHDTDPGIAVWPPVRNRA
jgi:hypothetical protein